MAQIEFKGDSWCPSNTLELDTSKLDYRRFGYTNASQLVRGVYPEGMMKEQVESWVRGSWGGHFHYFTDGKFEYVSTTD